jgi:hypothetical protein
MIFYGLDLALNLKMSECGLGRDKPAIGRQNVTEE